MFDKLLIVTYNAFVTTGKTLMIAGLNRKGDDKIMIEMKER
jgi:hypothetical protein